MIKVVDATATVEWLFLVDSRGGVWERPLPRTGFAETWEPLPLLPDGLRAARITMATDEGAVYVITEGGGRLFKYLAEVWEDVTPPFPEEPVQ
jgi:hypothetical protein